MRKATSSGWYVVAAALILLPTGWVGYDTGAQVRQTIDEVAVLPDSVDVFISLDAGEGRTIFQGQGAAANFEPSPGCEVGAGKGAVPPLVERVDTHVEVTLLDDVWVARQRFVAPSQSRVRVRCPPGDWALGPDVGPDGLGIVTTFAGWTGSAAVRVVPGLVVGVIMALVVARRRRTAV